MKASFSLKIVTTNVALSYNQRTYIRARLKQFVKKKGIISICLDDKSFFIEYEPDVLDKAFSRNLLLDYEFPLEAFMIESITDAK